MNRATVSIQGHPGSYHDIARRQYFRNGHRLQCRDDFKDVFHDIGTGGADFAVAAVENSLYGSINQVYDLLLKHRFWVCGEIYLHIQHCLLGIPGSSPGGIREVYSHPLALAQCEDYLDDTLTQAMRFERHDTAGSAADIAAWNETHRAAIASREAGEMHGLQVIATDIETNPQNYTRFIVMQKPPGQDARANKSSIILYTAHEPGALYRALGVFADHDINLSKLESRPIIGKAWHYMFYIDIETGLQETRAQNAVSELERMGNEVITLGSYQSGRMPD